MNGTFGGRIVQQLPATLETGNRSGIQDYGPFAQMGQGRFGHIEVSIDIRLERMVPLVFRNTFESFLMLLKGSVVDEYVEFSKLPDCLFDAIATKFRIRNVAFDW